MEKARIVSVSSKSQITLSGRARKVLGLEKGSTLMEVVVGGCVILIPQNHVLEKIREHAQEALQKAGLGVKEDYRVSSAI